MGLSNLLEKWGRSIFEGPFGWTSSVDEPPEVAEIRIAILEEIRKKSYRSGGRSVFPFNCVRINLRGVSDEQAPVFQGAFLKKYFEQEIRSQLKKADCRHPGDLHVEVRVSRAFPAKDEKWLWIETEMQENGGGGGFGRPAARLVVIEGKANEPEMALTKQRTNIGRTVDVYKAEGLARRNDLVFAEENPINHTVSREHAHIVFDSATGEYRIFNDRYYNREDAAESAGIWIVRDGMSQPVHRDARGTRLVRGDEIHLGKAVLKFE